MWRIIGGILLVSLVIVALKLAIVAAFLIGLIFRPKETFGLILFLTGIALFNAHPVIGLTLIAALGLWAWYRSIQKRKAETSVLLLPPSQRE